MCDKIVVDIASAPRFVGQFIPQGHGCETHGNDLLVEAHVTSQLMEKLPIYLCLGCVDEDRPRHGLWTFQPEKTYQRLQELGEDLTKTTLHICFSATN